LHLDVTCAINIMAYAAPATADGEIPSPPGAIWDIFEPRDTQILNSYLRHKYPNMGVDDPVNRQLFYLSSDDLSILNTEKWGYTRPFRILQEPGDAVLIPAGCAHQVANGRSSIKVAVDFISAERIHVCEDVMTMFREMAAQYKYPLCNADGGSSTEDGGSGSGKPKSKPRKRRLAVPVVTKSSLGIKEDILQLYNCLYFTFFQIRGLDLSLKLRSYGPGWERIGVITQGNLPNWQRAPINGVMGTREDKNPVGEGRGEVTNRVASVNEGEEVPEGNKGRGGMVVTGAGEDALEGSKGAEDGQISKAEPAAGFNEASAQVLELPIHV
jgi:JmjC domain, hydroxylase